MKPWSAFGLSLILLSGCATPRPPAPRPEDAAAATRQQIVHAAERLLGAPYVPGGESPDGLDCSGLVQYTYREAGITVPRSTAQLYLHAQPLDRVRPGDLLFFKTDPRRVSHVGIYLGNSQMIHASSGSRRVRKADLDLPYWRERLVSGATFLDCAGTC